MSNRVESRKFHGAEKHQNLGRGLPPEIVLAQSALTSSRASSLPQGNAVTVGAGLLAKRPVQTTRLFDPKTTKPHPKHSPNSALP